MKKKIFYISIFILFIIILFLSPIAGDDWGNYIEGSKGFYHCISQSIVMYFAWEGRFVSRVLINILTYHKVLWNIINSIFITSIVFLIIKIVNPQHKKIICLLSLLVILLMNIFTFSQIVVWVAGNITYLFVIPLLLGYFYYLFDYKKNNKFLVCLFAILNFIMPMFIEHMAVILVISNIIFFTYRFVKKRCIDKELLLYLILSIIATLLMLLSPGTKIRSGMENIEFSKLSLFNKIIYNIPNFINYTFVVNYFLLILMVYANIYLIKKHTKNKLLKYLLLIFVTIIPILNCVNYFISYFYMYPLFKCNIIIHSLYYGTYLIIMLYFIVIDTNKDKSKKIIFFFIIGILSNLVMMISPIWGYRTSFATYIFLSISMLMIIDKYIKERKLYNIILSIFCIGSSLFYIILHISVHFQYMDNLKVIETAKRRNSKVIEIIKYPYYVNCNINPTSYFHIMIYKKYYGLNKDVKIVLKENNWKYFIFYNK